MVSFQYGPAKMWDAFDEWLDERIAAQLRLFFTMDPVEAGGTLTEDHFLRAIAALEARERQLPPEFN